MSAQADEPQGQSRCGAILVPTKELSWLAMTADQAQILYQVIREQRANITERWSHGIFMGLSDSLCDIHRAGGAYTRPISDYSRPL
jgi:hypothetical protein